MSINCGNLHFDKVIIFFEDKDGSGHVQFPSLSNKKIELVKIDRRPTYRDFFDYANERLKNDYVIISNADIYYDGTSNIERVKEVQPNHLWAVCRYNYDTKEESWSLQGEGIQGSSDSWIFKAPIVDFDNDILVGMAGCDSYLCQKAVEAGIIVSNPGLSIITKHEHDDMGERNRFLDSETKATYKELPDFMQCRYNTYCPPASVIEDNIFASNKTLRYRLFSLPLSLYLIKAYRKIKSVM
ncbi:hypothetical protein JYT96_01835 [Gammaproteobacteria bacterium AH-315-C21]|nr:hypothetical protein [Gammaproteobacteria bacterium AH-315-C21]